MNPCPCGFAGDPAPGVPVHAGSRVSRYATRLSGPLRDRIDLTVAVAAVPAHELQSRRTGGIVRRDPRAGGGARERQLRRSGVLNARLHGRALRARATLSRTRGR